MKTIWKFQLEMADTQKVVMPRSANILTAQVQNGIICLWAMVESTAPIVEYTIAMYGTGMTMVPFAGKQIYIDTVQLGGFVWHLFHQEYPIT